MDEIAKQIKVPELFGMVGVNGVGIRWKDKALIRGGLTDASNSFFFYERSGVKLVVRSQQTP